MKILLVDDSRTIRNIAKRVLGTVYKYAIFLEANDGVEGLQMYKDHDDIDVCLLDWNMPNMNGLEMLQEVRKFNVKSCIIMCTTEAEKTRVLESAKAGANNYIIKPFTPDGLLTNVESSLKKLCPA